MGTEQNRKSLSVLYTLFAFSFVFMTAVMIWTLKKGVGLRMAPLIKPTEFQETTKDLSEQVYLRLYQEFTQRPNLCLVIPSGLSTQLQAEAIVFKTGLKEKVQLLNKGLQWIEVSDVSQCPPPSQPNPNDNGFTPNSLITPMHLHFMPFDRSAEPSKECEQSAKLLKNCITTVAVSQIKKKLERKKNRLFFMNSFADNDFYLFVESEPSNPIK